MDEIRDNEQDSEANARREFFKKVGKTAATAVSAAVILAASKTPAVAGEIYGGFGDR